jgi:hypothetical protein
MRSHFPCRQHVHFNRGHVGKPPSPNRSFSPNQPLLSSPKNRRLFPRRAPSPRVLIVSHRRPCGPNFSSFRLISRTGIGPEFPRNYALSALRNRRNCSGESAGTGSAGSRKRAASVRLTFAKVNRYVKEPIGESPFIWRIRGPLGSPCR